MKPYMEKIKDAQYKYPGGITELQKMFNNGDEIPLLMYNGYLVTYEYDDYIFYGIEGCAIGKLDSLIDACRALVIYGDDLDELDFMAEQKATGMYYGVADLVRTIRGF